MIAKQPCARAASQPRIYAFADLQQIRMPVSPILKVARRNGNSDSPNRLQAKREREHSRQEFDRRVMNVDEYPIGNSGLDTFTLETAERLISSSL